MRTLVYIPIIHTQADMGALGDLLQRIKVSRVGPARLKDSAKLVDQMWDQIEQTVESVPVVSGKVRIYQDGLAVCGNESQIVRELAEAGSRNHQLLLRLQQRGAILMGTESPELLIEEYQLATASLQPATARTRRRQEELGRVLLEKRDRFIAGRINTTLQEGETGILFVGMLHFVQRYLERNFEIRYPVKIP